MLPTFSLPVSAALLTRIFLLLHECRFTLGRSRWAAASDGPPAVVLPRAGPMTRLTVSHMTGYRPYPPGELPSQPQLLTVVTNPMTGDGRTPRPPLGGSAEGAVQAAETAPPIHHWMHAHHDTRRCEEQL